MNRISRLLIIVLLLALTGCSICASPASILGDLAYHRSREENSYTVWIREDTIYVPYLVLSSSYASDNSCLVLRKNILDAPRPFNDNVPYSGYYPDSIIDQYLNDTFFYILSECVRQQILETSFCVTSKTSLWGGVAAEENIARKVFLLSVYEVSGRSSGTMVKEGEPLAFFSTEDRCIAITDSGEYSGWWLRTPNLSYSNLVYGVDQNGIVNVGGVGGFGESYLSGVRPAFCISADEPICLLDGRYYLVIDAPVSETVNP